MNALLAILAGGDGRRMGGNKPLAMIGGVTLLERSLVWARTQALPVVLAVRSPRQMAWPPGVALALDRPGVDGPLAGVLGALDYAADRGFDGVVTAPVDAPWLPHDLCVRLSGAANLGATVAASEGQWHAVCAYWPVAELPRLSAWSAGQNKSVRGALRAISAVPVEWPVAGRDPFANLNDPAAIAAAEMAFQNGI